MKRREFLYSGAAALMGASTVRYGFAQNSFSGPYVLGIEANGGWDPTSFCDPKGRGLGPNGDISDYASADIGTAGNIAYAPPPDSFPGGGGLFTNQSFFSNHFERLAVINGINYGTNSHDVGRTAAWTGSRTLGYPSIGALVASEVAPELAMPFVATQSTQASITKGVVPQTIINGGDLNVIREVAFSNRSNVFNANTDRQYFDDSVLALVQAASGSRRARQIADQRLDRVRRSMETHNAARAIDDSTLTAFVDGLNAASTPNSYVQSRTQADRLFDESQSAFAAFEAGAAATAQIRLGGFDTHDNHDRDHYPRLMDYLAAVDNIIDDAVSRGLGNNLIIVMGSDFGRTNKINNDNGKDHWSHGSMMVWGAPALISGNRVVGATDDNQISQRLNPSTLAVDSSGVSLTMESVHQALRDKIGIGSNPTITQNYAFGAPDLALLG